MVARFGVSGLLDQHVRERLVQPLFGERLSEQPRMPQGCSVELRRASQRVGALGRSRSGFEVADGARRLASAPPVTAELGFALFDLRPCYWKREAGRSLGGPYGQVIWGDALYLRSVSALQALASGLDTDLRQSKVLHALSIALLYGYVDYALDIASSTSALWSEDDVTAIEQALRATDEPGGTLSKLPGSRQLGAALGRLREELREAPEGWSVSDPELGNLT